VTEAAMLEPVVGLIVALASYLLFTLLHPERF
jgi:K+-transporting ATPase KdpF subunit